MKYVVDVGGVRADVELDGDRARIGDAGWTAVVAAVDGTPVQLLTIDGRTHRMIVRRGETRGSYTLWLDGHRFDVEALDARTRAIRDMANLGGKAKGPAPVRAPMPGLIVRVTVAVGVEVQAGQSVVVMEAMKMENELRAETAGVVRVVHVAAGRAVEKGAILIELD